MYPDVYLIVTDKQDEGIKEMCSTGISFGRSKLLQSCSNFTLKPELEPTVVACLAGRDAQVVLYSRFVEHSDAGPSGDSKRLGCFPDAKNIYRLELTSKWLAKRELR